MNTDWIKGCLASAQKTHTSVPLGVVAHLGQLLSGPASEREMRSAELNSEADRLLAEMIGAPATIAQ